ncbi:MAG: hypothetical protein MUF33_10900 [Candidatus Nanopelagicales bacterium]|jgi:hypothetical protein|nr:hypothetical protein [Candidatus Nanopelagicales bacterium]
MGSIRKSWIPIAVAVWAVSGAGGWWTAAWAVNTDNRVGNLNYQVECVNGVEGSVQGPVCRTDNATLSYYMDSSGEFELESPDREHVTWIMANRYDPTDLSVSYDSSPTFSGSAETDVIYQEGIVTSGYIGATWCNDSSPSPIYECDQQYVRIRGNGVYDRPVVCHETGHAVGLLHGQNSSPVTSNSDPDLGCMTTPVSTSLLGQNQINRINSMY